MALRCLSKKAFALPYRQFSSSVVPAATAVSSSSASSLTTTSVTDERLYLPLSSLLPRNSDQSKASSQVVSLDPSVFSHPIRRDILHLCVVHHRDGLRQGSANTKTRSEIKCSGRKLRPQKGTGRARLGDASSPMLRGGAVAFGPKPRDFSTKLPRKRSAGRMEDDVSIEEVEAAMETLSVGA
ncbi:54S ribosomal protein, mitochondrial [Tulasnella sp. 419]|nr:54S ribosomal protein, mitochondrial [Tulasnella sp. 419]